MNHKRLHTRLLALLLCCALVLPLSACGEAKSTTQQIFAMDTVMDLTAYGKKADDGINAETAGNLIDAVEHMFFSPARDKDYYSIFGIRYSQYFRSDLSVSRKIMLGDVLSLIHI